MLYITKDWTKPLTMDKNLVYTQKLNRTWKQHQLNLIIFGVVQHVLQNYKHVCNFVASTQDTLDSQKQKTPLSLINFFFSISKSGKWQYSMYLIFTFFNTAGLKTTEDALESILTENLQGQNLHLILRAMSRSQLLSFKVSKCFLYVQIAVNYCRNLSLNVWLLFW